MTRHEGGNQLPLEALMELRAQELIHLMERVKRKAIPQNTFLNRVHEIISELDNITKAEERRHLDRIAVQSQVESLGTDDKGHRSEREMEESGKAFATGVASRCLAVAVVHQDVGIGAAHINPITSTATIEYLSRRMTSEPLSLDILFNDDPNRAMQMVGEERLTSVTRSAIQLALSEFREIEDGPEYIPSDTHIFMTGLNFITPSIKDSVINTALETIHMTVQEQQTGTGRGTNISITENLMEDGGTIYGGRNHPVYNFPSYYKLT